MNKPVRPPSSDPSGWRYLGLATQLMVYLVIAVWAGYRLDHQFSLFPFLTAGLPVLILILVFYKITRDTRN